MKFNCGPTWEERYEASEKWHPKFLWWPVRIGRDCIWLESVWRRRLLQNLKFAAIYGDLWEYRRMTKPTPVEPSPTTPPSSV